MKNYVVDKITLEMIEEWNNLTLRNIYGIIVMLLYAQNLTL